MYLLSSPVKLLQLSFSSKASCSSRDKCAGRVDRYIQPFAGSTERTRTRTWDRLRLTGIVQYPPSDIPVVIFELLGREELGFTHTRINYLEVWKQ